jgi:uncharacterized membrane protein YdjX (TVP38/TMEM64 family)
MTAAALFGVSLVALPHSPAGIERLVAQAGPLAAVAFVALWLVATPALVSGTLLAAAGGMLFGTLVGSLVAVAGAAAGGAVSLTIARIAGRDGLGGLGGRAERAANAIERRGFRAMLCLRAAPGVPATILNYAAGLARVRTRDFLAATLIAGAPRAIAYSALGANAAHPSAVALVLPTAILIVMGIVGAALARSTFRAPARA